MTAALRSTVAEQIGPDLEREARLRSIGAALQQTTPKLEQLEAFARAFGLAFEGVVEAFEAMARAMAAAFSSPSQADYILTSNVGGPARRRPSRRASDPLARAPHARTDPSVTPQWGRR